MWAGLEDEGSGGLRGGGPSWVTGRWAVLTLPSGCLQGIKWQHPGESGP